MGDGVYLLGVGRADRSCGRALRNGGGLRSERAVWLE
jgi:hypothetical protein